MNSSGMCQFYSDHEHMMKVFRGGKREKRKERITHLPWIHHNKIRASASKITHSNPMLCMNKTLLKQVHLFRAKQLVLLPDSISLDKRKTLLNAIMINHKHEYNHQKQDINQNEGKKKMKIQCSYVVIIQDRTVYHGSDTKVQAIGHSLKNVDTFFITKMTTIQFSSNRSKQISSITVATYSIQHDHDIQSTFFL